MIIMIIIITVTAAARRIAAHFSLGTVATRNSESRGNAELHYRIPLGYPDDTSLRHITVMFPPSREGFLIDAWSPAFFALLSLFLLTHDERPE
jgi:hypothetical protein